MYWLSVAFIRDASIASDRAGAQGSLEHLRDRSAETLTGNKQEKWRRRALVLRVHFDALWLSPLDYLQGVAWRLRGLKVRSKSRLSALIGRSPSAYQLWIAAEEPRLLMAQAKAADARTQTVIPVIDCRGGSQGLEETLRSLSVSPHAGRPIVIGDVAGDGVDRIADPKDIVSMIGEGAVWLCPLSSGDRWAPAAATAYASAAAAAQAPVVYSDDDLLDRDGKRREPHFKPDWNPDLFEYHDYLTGSCIIKVTATMLAATGSDWPKDLITAAIASGTPLHLPLVLHHRRSRPEPRLPANHSLPIPNPVPRVSIIIPTRNQLALLRSCIDGVRRTAYGNSETILIDNGSDDPAALAYLAELAREGMTVLRMPGPFNFSILNNAAVRAAQGEYLCFLNNDVEMLDGEWLENMVAQAARPEIGAVGARLLYPDGTIQHAGVVTGIGGGAGHAHRLQPLSDPGYFNRVHLPQRASAVTAACMVVAKDKFLAVGGFDETDFPVAFNDVDLCLKLNARGWESFYEPRATLVHHESKSRGTDRAKAKKLRLAGELAALKRKWHTDTRRDPYHHPHLSRFCEQFLVAI